MSDSPWTVSNRVPGASSPSKEKIPYIARLNVNEKMNDAQKLTVSNYNLMRTTLIENGLMNEK